MKERMLKSCGPVIRRRRKDGDRKGSTREKKEEEKAEEVVGQCLSLDGIRDNGL